MQERAHRLGILAGGGSLPREIAALTLARGGSVEIVALKGEANADFGDLPVTWVSWGQIGAMIRTLKAAKIDAMVIVGGVHRPELGALKPDLGFFINLPAIVKIVASGGDDSVLRRVIRFFEQNGLRVVGPADAAPELVIGEGPLGAVKPSEDDATDVALGFHVIRALGPFDVGQSVVVSNGAIAAIEGAEGTDRMMARAAQRRGLDRVADRFGVLVKRSKPGQDLRVDMPAIGPATVSRAVEGRLKGIAVEAQRVIALRRHDAIHIADTTQTFVAGFRDDAGGAPGRRFKAHGGAQTFRTLGRVTPSRHAIKDAEKGVAAMRALLPLGAGRSLVVVRNHILAVDAGEGAVAVIERARTLRQWASLTRQRRGVAVVDDGDGLSGDVIRAIAASGYAGAALLATAGNGEALSKVVEAANAAGLFVVLANDGMGDAA